MIPVAVPISIPVPVAPLIPVTVPLVPIAVAIPVAPAVVVTLLLEEVALLVVVVPLAVAVSISIAIPIAVAVVVAAISLVAVERFFVAVAVSIPAISVAAPTFIGAENLATVVVALLAILVGDLWTIEAPLLDAVAHNRRAITIAAERIRPRILVARAVIRLGTNDRRARLSAVAIANVRLRAAAVSV
jgi:hypothetical protein